MNKFKILLHVVYGGFLWSIYTLLNFIAYKPFYRTKEVTLSLGRDIYFEEF